MGSYAGYASNRTPFTLIELARRDLLASVPGRRPRNSCYKFNYVVGSNRAPWTPRVSRLERMKSLHGLMAFYRNRFYDIDRWYKARIVKPLQYPTCYVIEPSKFYKSLEERLEELARKDSAPIDIGFPYEQKIGTDSLLRRLARIRREHPPEIESAARHRTLKIDLAAIDKETARDIRPKTARQIAEHYGIFRDLFHPDAYFHPVVPMRVNFEDAHEKDVKNPIFYGNIIQPEDTVKKPGIDYDAEEGSFWTLLLTNPDGNLFEENKEMAHWLICNIPQNRIDEGETLIDYLQSLPPKGTGYHRFVFVLFRQDNGKIDLSEFKKTTEQCKNLKERTFDTPSFYKRFEDEITPAGLAFFQASWDESCTHCFHRVLEMPEPLFEYEWPQPKAPKQENFPAEPMPFNEYLDQFRDPKDIEKELLTKRLKRISPFKNTDDAETVRRRRYYPNVFWQRDEATLPSWLHLVKNREQQGVSKYKALYENPID